MYVLDYIFISSFVVCRTPSLLSLLILTALRRFPKMFRWKTVGMLVRSFSLPATCVQRVGDPQRMHASYRCCPDDLHYHLVFFSTFEELKLPISGPMERAGVTKLYEPFPTPCLYVAPAACMVGRVPLIPLFLAGNSTPTIPHQYSQHKRSGFPAGGATRYWNVSWIFVRVYLCREFVS